MFAPQHENYYNKYKCYPSRGGCFKSSDACPCRCLFDMLLLINSHIK